MSAWEHHRIFNSWVADHTFALNILLIIVLKPVHVNHLENFVSEDKRLFVEHEHVFISQRVSFEWSIGNLRLLWMFAHSCWTWNFTFLCIDRFSSNHYREIVLCRSVTKLVFCELRKVNDTCFLRKWLIDTWWESIWLWFDNFLFWEKVLRHVGVWISELLDTYVNCDVAIEGAWEVEAKLIFIIFKSLLKSKTNLRV